MDYGKFDALARSLAAHRSRRSLIGGLVAFGASLLGGREVGAQQVTQAQCGNKICKNNPGKCTNGCVCCVYANGNSRCRPPGTCSPGETVCTPIQILNPAFGCPASTTTTTTPRPSLTCASAGDCAAGYTCINGGCFLPCTAGGSCPGCPDCACETDAIDGGRYCLTFESNQGVCQTNVDCPSGRLCSHFEASTLSFLCTRPCCAGA